MGIIWIEITILIFTGIIALAGSIQALVALLIFVNRGKIAKSLGEAINKEIEIDGDFDSADFSSEDFDTGHKIHITSDDKGNILIDGKHLGIRTSDELTDETIDVIYKFGYNRHKYNDHPIKSN